MILLVCSFFNMPRVCRAPRILTTILFVLFVAISILCFYESRSLNGPKRRCDVYPEQIGMWKGNALLNSMYGWVDSNCTKLISRNSREMDRVSRLLDSWTNPLLDVAFYDMISTCSVVQALLSPDNFYNSAEEKSFPIAYVMLFHNSPQQIMRLLRVIYRPQNIYCLHVDAKSDKRLIKAFRALSKCLDNVFVPPVLVDVKYRHFSTVEAILNCYKHLLYTHKDWKWKYALNICGKELPVSSNRMIVEDLKRANGSSIIDVHDLLLEQFKDRFTHNYFFNPLKNRLERGKHREDHAPQLFKSLSYIGASRDFVKFLLQDKLVQEIAKYMYTAKAPDEEFFATSYMLPNAPKGKAVRGVKMVTTFFSHNDRPFKCTKKKVRNICILNFLDLPAILELANRGTRHFFFNKFYLEYDHVIMDCMEKRIVAENQLEYKRDCLAV